MERTVPKLATERPIAIRVIAVGVKADWLRGLARFVQPRLNPQHLFLHHVAQRRDGHARDRGKVVHQPAAAASRPDHAQTASGTTIVGATQYQYQDVGVKIDCRPRVRENGLSVDLTVDLTSVLKPQETDLPVEHPVFRNNSFSSDTVVPFGKATVVGTLDDVTSDRRYEIEITATQVK